MSLTTLPEVGMIVQPRVTTIDVEIKPPVQVIMEARPTITPLTIEIGNPQVGTAQPVAAGAATHTHTQNEAAAVWTIPNPFGVPCAAVTVKDVAGRTVLASIYGDASVVVIDFPVPFAGSAYLIRS